MIKNLYILYFLNCLFFQTVYSQEKLFTLIPAEESGVHFQNTIEDVTEHNILIYVNYYNGGGVGIADFNNDGLQDLYFTGNLEGDELYLNKGDFKFENITQKTGIVNDQNWSSGVAIADVNGDGFKDIYVCKELYDHQPERRKNKLYINQGDLTFKEEAEKWGVADSQRSRQALFMDYDKDGFVDLFVMNQPPNPGNFSEYSGQYLLLPQFTSRLYRNINNTSFEDVTQKAGLAKASFPNSAVASDLNNDGWVDIYIANDFYSPDFLFFNNGDGTFSYKTEESLKHISFNSMGVDAADINNDGHIDLMVLDMVAEDNYRQKANMSGMNVTAFWDVVEKGGHYQYMFNTLQLNNGNASFSEIAQYSNVAATDWSWSNLLADFDNDGQKDIYITNGLLRDIRNTDADAKVGNFVVNYVEEYIQKNPNQGTVELWEILPLDQTLELIPSVPLKNYMYVNQGNLQFKNQAEEWGLAQPSFSNGAAYGDLDNDGDLDLVVNNVNAKAFLYRNNTVEKKQTNYIRFELLPSNGESIWGTRLDLFANGTCQTQEISNIRGMFSTSESIVHFGLGKTNQIDSMRIQWANGKKKIMYAPAINKLHEITSKNGEHFKSIDKPQAPIFEDISLNHSLQFLHKENDFNDYEKQVLLPHKLSQLGPAIAKGDVNGDDLEDVFIGGASGQEAVLFLQSKTGEFQKSPQQSWHSHKTSEDISAVFFDADGDKDLDLYVVSGGNEFEPKSNYYLDRLYLNDGTGKFDFKKESLPPIFESGGVVKSADFDKDGDLDLFIGNRMIPWNYPEPPPSYVLENKEGKFEVHQQSAPLFEQLGLVTDMVWIDLDGDEDEDLVVVGEWMNIQFFENKKGVFTPHIAPNLSDYSGWWFSIEKADLDGDGDQDLVVGNLGENYKYKATEEQPFEIHYDDFDQNGNKDIVLSYYNYGIQYPLRGFSCSSEQIPDLKSEFKNYDLFASLNLKEIYGPSLEESYHLDAKHFESILLVNENGHFTPKKLPYQAQFSSINDILVKDYNSDGFEDILLIGNLFHSEIETPRNDAGIGLLLTNEKDNNFTPMSVNHSGFFASKDAKKAIEIEIGGTTHVLVANNNDSLQIFSLLKLSAKPR